jgi:hypothetical protein
MMGAAGEPRLPLHSVMPGLVPGIHDMKTAIRIFVDARDKPGHDEWRV